MSNSSSLPLKSNVYNSSVRVHPTLEELVRLQFEARDFTFLPRQPVHSLLSGRHASRLRGRGLTFEELRQYRPGDDIRSIDWRATARLRSAHVRVYSEERDRPVLLVVDQRTTMFFGSAQTTKATVAAEVAALAAWRTVDRGDRVGAIVFDDEKSIQIKPQRSRSAVLQICHEMVRMNERLTAERRSDRPDGQLNNALQRAVSVAKHDHLVILITDYNGDDERTRELTTRLAAHNDVLAVLVYDPLGAQLPASGKMEATDGRRQVSIPETARFQEQFAEEFRGRIALLRDRLRAIRIPVLPLCTHEPVPEQVMAALGRR
ncbi:DUF58 domain-containing protein [Adhaeretor mobilis]|uniref:DUF58 domain-containing protein n=1 Tax=Adhaeretor mobilis TaxID=1930276 RepID=A0A517MSU7_9BACT|nr:DUF58 domain-containing protein [Adhaeretor mobilis]QDS97954.1 hypothetical protein HG15A2_12240 [Adhaeretor mobilis]